MARTIALVLVVLLAASGAASADLAPLAPTLQSEEGLPTPGSVPGGEFVPGVPGLPEIPALPAVPTDEVAATLDGATAPVLATVKGVLDCQPAVRIDLMAWGYDVVDSRFRDTNFLTAATLTREFEELIPIESTVNRVIWQPAGLLGALEPVTQPVTVITGYDVQTVQRQTVAELAVALAWNEVQLDVDELSETVYVALPAALGAVATGEGTIVNVCEPSTILARIPAIDCSGYDGCSMLPMRNGWYVDILSLDVRLADAETDADLPWSDGEGILVSGDSLRTRVLDEAEDQGLWPGASALAKASPAPGTVVAAASPAIPAQTAGVVGLAGLSGSLLAGLAVAFLRGRVL